MRITAGQKLTRFCFLRPNQGLPLSEIRRRVLPLRRNQLVAASIRQTISDFNQQHPETPIKLATVKKCSLTMNNLVWGSDIDWLTFYTDASPASRGQLAAELTQYLHSMGIYFVRPGEKDEHNFVRCYETGKITELDFNDFILSVFYDGQRFLLFDEKGCFVGEPVHIPLEVQHWQIVEKVVARMKIFSIFQALSEEEIHNFLASAAVPALSYQRFPNLYQKARQELIQFVNNPIIPHNQREFYQAILLQLHYLHFGSRLGMVPERNWFVPQEESEVFQEALNLLTQAGLIYWPFTGGVFPKWDLYFPSFLDEGLGEIKINFFDESGRVFDGPDVSQIAGLPDAEKFLRKESGSEDHHHISEIVRRLAPELSSINWLAVQILASRDDSEVIMAMLSALRDNSKIVEKDDYSSLAREDLIRLVVLWLLAQKYPRLGLLEKSKCRKVVQDLEFTSSVYQYSRQYTQKILSQEQA